MCVGVTTENFSANHCTVSSNPNMDSHSITIRNILRNATYVLGVNPALTTSANAFSDDFLNSLNVITLSDNGDNGDKPKYLLENLFHKANRPKVALIRCNDFIDYIENCVPKKILSSLDAGKRWDFDFYRTDMETKRLLIRYRFSACIERVIKQLPNRNRRQMKTGRALGKQDDPYKSFVGSSVVNFTVEFLNKTLKNFQKRQKVLSSFRNAVLKVVWDFHVKNNEPWRYIMFYWKIVVDKELKSAEMAESSIVGDQQKLGGQTASGTGGHEPFHSLIVVAQTYVDSVSKNTMRDTADRSDGEFEFRTPDHVPDFEQAKFYEFYDEFLYEYDLTSTQERPHDAFDEFRRKTVEAVKTYCKAVRLFAAVSSPHPGRVVHGQRHHGRAGAAGTSPVQSQNHQQQQVFMKKRIRRIHPAPPTLVTRLGSLKNVVADDAEPMRRQSSSFSISTNRTNQEQSKNSASNLLAPPTTALSPTFEQRKLSLPDLMRNSPTSTMQHSPIRRKRSTTINPNPHQQQNQQQQQRNGSTKKSGANQMQIQIAVPHHRVPPSQTSPLPQHPYLAAIMTNRSTGAQPVPPKSFVSPNQLREIVERLRRPLDRSVKSKALRQLLRKENANLAKKRFKSEREVAQIVDRLSTLNDRPAFDYSNHVDFEKSLRKYDPLKNESNKLQQHHNGDHSHSDNEEDSKLLKQRKMSKNIRLFGSSRALNESNDKDDNNNNGLISVEKVRPRTQSQKL